MKTFLSRSSVPSVPTFAINSSLWHNLPQHDFRISWPLSRPTYILARQAAQIGAIYLQDGIYGPIRFCSCSLFEVTKTEIIITLFPYAL